MKEGRDTGALIACTDIILVERELCCPPWNSFAQTTSACTSTMPMLGRLDFGHKRYSLLKDLSERKMPGYLVAEVKVARSGTQIKPGRAGLWNPV